MKIGIDVSQLAYEGTGVANYIKHLVKHLLTMDDKNEYVIFSSSLRQSIKYKVLSSKYRDKANVRFKIYKLPPLLLDILWNRLHIVPIEMFIGNVDVFITSDWVEPPTRKAKKATILYDLIVYKYPKETDAKIVATQKRKLKWVKKESDIVFCISEATKRDAMEILGLEESKLKVVYPGI